MSTYDMPDSILKMYKDAMSAKQKKELQDIAKDIAEEAKNVVKDYEENPSELSGSSIEIHEDSPFIDERFKDNQWKHVLRHLPIDTKKSDDS